jgi:hypothetical protein
VANFSEAGLFIIGEGLYPAFVRRLSTVQVRHGEWPRMRTDGHCVTAAPFADIQLAPVAGANDEQGRPLNEDATSATP